MSYLHGYHPEEAERLRAQARALAPWVHEPKLLSGRTRLLEVGSGVGGQTALLLETYPDAHITTLEREASYHEACADWVMADADRARRVTPALGDALSLGDPNLLPALSNHDGVFVCWVLEHCPDPAALLAAVRTRMAPGGRIVLHEVFNQSFHVAPTMPDAVARYWEVSNAVQRRFGGDPDVGARLGQLLHAAGFIDIEPSAVLIQLDDREPARRAAFCDYFGELLRSGDRALQAEKMASAAEGEAADRAIRLVGHTPGTSVSYTLIRATATNPG